MINEILLLLLKTWELKGDGRGGNPRPVNPKRAQHEVNEFSLERVRITRLLYGLIMVEGAQPTEYI